MRFSTLIGIILGTAAILGAFYIENGDFTKLILPAPLMIVIGGTLMAGLASSSWKTFRKMFRLIFISFFPPKYDKKQIIFQLVEIAVVVRKHGILASEEIVRNPTHPYLQKIFQVCIDGADTATLEEVYSSEVENIEQRHNENIAFFNKLGGLSPTMGIIGTVMGLISTMSEAGGDGDANKLIMSIGVAFLATLWGIALANIIWIPIADKLQTIHNEEIQVLDVIFEGARCVLNGESPLIIATKLAGFYPISEQNRFNIEINSVIEKQKRKLKGT
jgi:chemotaxis protein MotA